MKSSLTRSESDLFYIAEAGRHIHGALNIANFERAFTIELDAGWNPLAVDGVRTARFSDAPVEIHATILDAQTAVSSVPRETVPSPILDPEQASWHKGRVL